VVLDVDNGPFALHDVEQRWLYRENTAIAGWPQLAAR